MSYYWTDLYLAQDIPDDMLAAAMATAFELPVDAVGVALEGTERGMSLWQRPETHLLVQRMREDQRGEFPVGLSIGLKSDVVNDLSGKLAVLAQKLETAIITDVETPEYTDSQWRLVAPDGWSGIVTVDDEAFNRDAFVLTPEARALLNAHTPSSPVRHAS